MWLLIVLSQNGFFVWLPLLGCVGLVSFSLKVSLSGEISVCVFCGWAGAGFASRFFKPVVDFRCGLSGSCTPNVGGGAHTAPISCDSIFNRHGVAEIGLRTDLNRGLVAVNSRKVAMDRARPCLSII